MRADDEVLEIGFGPGLAIEAAAQVARKVVGIDRSELMVRQARRRNARAIAQGKVELLHGATDRLAAFAGRFDKAFAINVYMFWSDPAAVLREVRAAMKPNGTLCLTLQPRLRTSSSEDTRRFAEKMAASLRDTGFANVRTAILAMAPVDTACVLGEA